MASAKARTKARTELVAPSRVPDMSDLVFATLELTNQAGRESATALGRNYANLAEHHRQYLRVERFGKCALNPAR